MVQTFKHLFCILLHFVVFWQSMRGLVWFVFPQLLLENDFNIKKFCNFHWAKKKFHISESISLFLNSPKQCVLYFFKKNVEDGTKHAPVLQNEKKAVQCFLRHLVHFH